MARSANSFEINGHTVQGGESATVELSAALLYTHTPVTLPVRVLCGRRPGPRLFLCGVIHGDEINGVEIVQRVLRHKSLKHLRGTLVAVPVVNIHGFISHSRYLPDRRDLNRCFPGNETGSLTSQLARLFMSEIVEKCTHGIDLHTASNHRCNLPQVRAHLDNEETRRLARAFGAPVILNSNLRDGSLRQAALEAGVHILLYEGGEALRFDEFTIRLGVAGVLSVMRALEMLPGQPYKPRVSPLTANTSTWVRAPQSGIFHPARPLGAKVKQDEILGAIADPFGDHSETLEAPDDGIIIAEQRLPLVNRGDALFHLARLEGSQGRPRDLSDLDEVVENEDDALLY